MNRAELQTLIETIQDGVPNTAATVRGVLSAIADGLSGTIKIIEVSNAYLSANFDPTGLGINLELGYAICNGNNGTRDWRGRVPMQYSTTYPTLGAIGGEATHVLTVNEMPSHSHSMNGATSTSGGTGNNLVNNANLNSSFVPTTNTTGGGQAHNNMQPYIVTLIVMKL